MHFVQIGILYRDFHLNWFCSSDLKEYIKPYKQQASKQTNKSRQIGHCNWSAIQLALFRLNLRTFAFPSFNPFYCINNTQMYCLFVCLFGWLVGWTCMTNAWFFLSRSNTQLKIHIQFLFSLYISNQYRYTKYHKRFWNLKEEGKQMNILLLGATQAKVRKNKPNYL